ncbi:hypothetical protein D028_0797 [Vibrio parahaemolyticus 50]|nr:hypothetical protein D028_0797 [Vibrio parahaemolyticus 50]EVU08843.1 hypothetical protein D018_0980 [Vibrio parahaemolyticus VP2007-007]
MKNNRKPIERYHCREFMLYYLSHYCLRISSVFIAEQGLK